MSFRSSPDVFPASAAPGRVHTDASLAAQVGTATIYTVTAGRIFYLVGFLVTAFNTLVGVNGDIRLDDAGVDKVPFIMPAAGVASAVAFQQLSAGGFSAQEPIPFVTNVRMRVVTGVVTYSVTITGYEE